jgi:hypothetical protein
VGNEAIDSLVRETFISRCSREDVLAPIDATVSVLMVQEIGELSSARTDSFRCIFSPECPLPRQ